MTRALARVICWLPATGTEDLEPDGKTPMTECGAYAIANVVNKLSSVTPSWHRYSVLPPDPRL